jgi:hypothetical protein
MPITKESLCTFVAEYGPVSVLDSRGKSTRLESRNETTLNAYEKADRVFFGHVWYSRSEFEQIVEDRLEEYY